MKRHCIVLAIICLVLAAAFPTMSTAAPTKISLAAWGAEAERRTIDALVAKFNETHPNIEVEVTYPAGGYEEKVLTMISGGVAPDVIQVQNGWNISQFIRVGVLQPLDKFLELSQVDQSAFVARPLIDELSRDGQVYAMPKGFTTKVMGVNVDLFNQGGLFLPDETWSLDDYRTTARKLTDGQGTRFGSMPLWTTLWMYLNGGGILGADNETILIHERPAVEGVKFSLDMNRDERATLQEPHVWTERAQTMWYSGKVAMWPDVGAWTLPTFTEKIKTWRYQLTPFPHKTTAPGAVPAAVTGWAMTASTTKTDAAWEFIRWASYEKAAQDIIATGALLPALRASVERWLAVGYPGGEAFMKELPYCAPEPTHPKMGDIWTIIGEEWGRARNGEVTVEAAHLSAKERIEALIRKNH